MGPAGEAPAVVTEAQGWRLHLSSRSSTGYAQAYASRSRRRARAAADLPGRRAASHAYHTVDGRQIFIGFFDSAVEAAVARAGGGVGGRTGRRPPGARCARLGHHLTMEPGPGSHDCP